ncbi:MAG TPA: hypothetical protein VLE72_01130 [Candidatus Saccharimonadales bacterium]|nr:hypothetical protein [Candidatus Saccharimonadales bacterium]
MNFIKSKPKWLIALVFSSLILLPTAAYALTSADFYSAALKWSLSNCQVSSATNTINNSVCFLLKRNSEISTSLKSEEDKNNQQQGDIDNLGSRVSSLESVSSFDFQFLTTADNLAVSPVFDAQNYNYVTFNFTCWTAANDEVHLEVSSDMNTWIKQYSANVCNASGGHGSFSGTTGGRYYRVTTNSPQNVDALARFSKFLELP